MTAPAMSAAQSSVPPVLEARDLFRRYGPVRALAGVSFALEAGQVLAVFGPNGAGKTTLLRILAGLLKPDTGEARLLGVPVRRGDADSRRRIGLISHQSLLYDGLTALENLLFVARLYGLDRPRQRGLAALEAVGLAERADSAAGSMSRGMTQRLAIARALLHEPDVVLLDEPFTGLDQRAAEALRLRLAALAGGGRGVVLVTHHLEEGLGLATHVAVQVAGRFAHLGPNVGDAASWSARYAELTAAA